MFPTATIVFREILEIALILSIVMAAIRELPSRYMLILTGLGLGMTGSALIAFFTDQISSAMDGMGQELFNALILLIAVAFLSWTVIWMKKHARKLSHKIHAMGKHVVTGEKPPYMIIFIVALSTLREGAEIVLFSYGMIASEQYSLSSILTGGLLGLVGGTIIGIMLYMGLLKTAKKHLFTVTSWMLMLLTAGMAAQAAGFLIAADMVPALIPQVWDSSAIIAGNSLLGKTLGVLIGYTPNPTGTELAFYLITLAVLVICYKRIGTVRKTTIS